MRKFIRLMASAVVAAAALASLAQGLPAAAQIKPGPPMKGSWKGTFESTSGNGSGNLSFKITKDKLQGGALRSLKGTGKFGPSGKRNITGNSTTEQTVFSFNPKRRSDDTYGVSGELSGDGKTLTGEYTIVDSQGEEKDHGTFSATKK